jgi:hypothetical protein
MSFEVSKVPYKSRRIRQGVFTLLVFFASFFSHSEHYAQLEFDVLSTFELHDCHLCQQGLDSPLTRLILKPVKFNSFHLLDTHPIRMVISSANYVYPQLRAPPKFI